MLKVLLSVNRHAWRKQPWCLYLGTPLADMHTLIGHLGSSIAAAQYLGIQKWHCLTLNLSHALVGGNACGPLDVWLKIRRRTPAVIKAKLHVEMEDFKTAAHSCQ